MWVMKLSLRTTHTHPLSQSPVIQATRKLQHQKPAASRAHGCATILPDTHPAHRAINFQLVKEGCHAPTFTSVKKISVSCIWRPCQTGGGLYATLLKKGAAYANLN